ncbi:MAG: type II toxin-antitoxin system HicB family antitoxin [Oscillospiraceae bacterium]|nr:type II toxin-antitoxin system HicB family antitoxin [Oscillospiraceae bacterium]
MAKYVFSAVLTPEDKGMYSVMFPDIEGCCSQGDSLADAVYMAGDALSLMLTDLEDSNGSIPMPTPINDVEHTPDQIVALICADTVEYRKELQQ